MTKLCDFGSLLLNVKQHWLLLRRKKGPALTSQNSCEPMEDKPTEAEMSTQLFWLTHQMGEDKTLVVSSTHFARSSLLLELKATDD